MNVLGQVGLEDVIVEGEVLTLGEMKNMDI